jgi:hypothetical protein
MGGINGRTQRFDPRCISGKQHIGLARSGRRRDTGAAPQSRPRAVELADEPPHLQRPALCRLAISKTLHNRERPVVIQTVFGGVLVRVEGGPKLASDLGSSGISYRTGCGRPSCAICAGTKWFSMAQCCRCGGSRTAPPARIPCSATICGRCAACSVSGSRYPSSSSASAARRSRPRALPG